MFFNILPFDEKKRKLPAIQCEFVNKIPGQFLVEIDTALSGLLLRSVNVEKCSLFYIVQFWVHARNFHIHGYIDCLSIIIHFSPNENIVKVFMFGFKGVLGAIFNFNKNKFESITLLFNVYMAWGIKIENAMDLSIESRMVMEEI